jgi:hypothetical protein
MMVEARDRGGRRPSVSDEQIRALLDKGLSNAAIAREVGLTPQAIGPRVKKIRERDEERANYLLPWVVREQHATGWVYRAVRGYAKRRRGEGASPRELSEGAELEAYLHREDAVVGYDYNRGFYLRSRQPDDGPSMLVKD